MKCQDYYSMTSCDLDAKSLVCRPHAAVAQQCQSVAAGPAGPATPAPGPANTLASLAECKQDTIDKVKAYFKLTDIIWIITRSLVLR